MAAFGLSSALAQTPAIPPAPPPPSSDSPAPALASATPADPAAIAAASETPKKEPLPVSLFFTAEERARIRDILAEHERLKNVKVTKAEDKAEDYLNQIAGSKPEPAESRTYVYPQFYLDSLVYHTPDDWVLMINRQRISSKYIPEGAEINVLSVDNEKVLLEWKPSNMERVNESWALSKNEDVLVDNRFGKVIFTLHPNQTFSSYVMRVLEGKVRPVVDNPTGAQVVAVPAAPAESPADGDGQPVQPPENITTEDIKNNVGLKGLNKTYKRMGLE